MKKILALLVLSTLVASAAVNSPFYVQSTGSNLNSGHTTNDSAIVTYTNAVSASSWDSATGIFTIGTGNPAADGVVLGGWASVYVIAGAVNTGFVGLVTATNATTITVSLTAKSGTAPATSSTSDTALKFGGAWKVPVTTNLFPFAFFQNTMTNASTTTQGLPPKIWVKGGSTYPISATLAMVNPGPFTVSGYTNTPGDTGRAFFDLTNATALAVLSTSSAVLNANFVQLEWAQSGASAGSVAGFNQASSSGEINFYRCVAHNIRNSGFSIAGPGNVVGCEAYLCNTANAAAQGGFLFAVAAVKAKRCISHDNAGSNASGFVVGAATTLSGCISDSNGAHGYLVSSISTLDMDGSVAYNNTGAGVDLTAASGMTANFENCIFTKNGTYGITSSGSPIRNGFIVNCAFSSGTQTNGVGTISASAGSLEEIGTITLPANATGFVDAANGNFIPNQAVLRGTGRGLFTQSQASYTGTVSYPDVGAVQHLDPGTSYSSVQ
jgi:hypothetical protein